MKCRNLPMTLNNTAESGERENGNRGWDAHTEF